MKKMINKILSYHMNLFPETEVNYEKYPMEIFAIIKQDKDNFEFIFIGFGSLKSSSPDIFLQVMIYWELKVYLKL